MTDLEIAAKFRKAVEVLNNEGWHQGSLSGPDGLCAAGALWRVSWQAPMVEGIDLRLRADQRVGGEGTDHKCPLAVWNDAPERTKEEVVALFEGLAHDLELRHQIATASPVETDKVLEGVPSLS